MQRAKAVTLIAGLVAAPCASTRADDCFCLIHTSGAILRGCEAYRAPADFYSTAVCTDPETGKQSQQTMYSEWKRIEGGADRCKPCKPVPRGTAREVPRGGKDAPP